MVAKSSPSLRVAPVEVVLRDERYRVQMVAPGKHDVLRVRDGAFVGTFRLGPGDVVHGDVSDRATVAAIADLFFAASTKRSA